MKKIIKENESKILNIQKTEDDAEFDDFTEFNTPVKSEKQEIKNLEMVSVNGVLKPFTEITEDDKELMTEDEYTKYFEIYSSYNN